MYPILLGLKEFIGSENNVFGGFRNSKGESSGKWEIKDGKMLIDGIALVRKTPLKSPVKKDIPIIILTSCYTASAGEMTAVVLIGRNNTYVIGEPTADYTTAVQGFRINKDAGLNLSTDYVVDQFTQAISCLMLKLHKVTASKISRRTKKSGKHLHC